MPFVTYSYPRNALLLFAEDAILLAANQDVQLVAEWEDAAVLCTAYVAFMVLQR